MQLKSRTYSLIKFLLCNWQIMYIIIKNSINENDDSLMLFLLFLSLFFL